MATFKMDRADDLNQKLEEANKKAEATEWKVEILKQRAIRERKMADMAVAKSEEQRKLAEMNSKMALSEKDRADDLNMKLEEAKNRIGKIEKEMHMIRLKIYQRRKEGSSSLPGKEKTKTYHLTSQNVLPTECKPWAEELLPIVSAFLAWAELVPIISYYLQPIHKTKCSGILVEAQDLQSNAGRDAELTSNACAGMLKNDSQILEKIHCQLIVIGNQLSVMTPANLGAPVTDSRMDPPYGGSYQKIIQSSATTSSPAYFADRPLVGSLERGTLSVMTPANLGEGLSNCEPSIGRSSEKMRTRYNEPGVSESLKESSCRELFRPCKKRKTSSDGTVAIHSLQNYVEPENMLNSNTNSPNDCMLASSPEPDLMKLHGHFKDGMNNITGHYYFTRDFDKIVDDDHMKLLDLDNAVDEDSYRRAIAMPLSPTLPEVELLEAGNSEMPLFNIHDNSTSVSRFHIIEWEKKQTNLLRTIDFSKKLDSLSRRDRISTRSMLQLSARAAKLGDPDLFCNSNTSIFQLSCQIPSQGGAKEDRQEEFFRSSGGEGCGSRAESDPQQGGIVRAKGGGGRRFLGGWSGGLDTGEVVDGGAYGGGLGAGEVVDGGAYGGGLGAGEVVDGGAYGGGLGAGEVVGDWWRSRGFGLDVGGEMVQRENIGGKLATIASTRSKFRPIMKPI
ncbi:hypothetical protein ACS0TY_032374 [Phlomoides rotata]